MWGPIGLRECLIEGLASRVHGQLQHAVSGVGVDLTRSPAVGMAEQMLRHALVHTVLGQRRSVGMPQMVNTSVLDTGARDNSVPDSRHVALAERGADRLG